MPLVPTAGGWGTACTAKPMAPWKGDYFWPLFSVRDAKAGWEWHCTFLFWSTRPPRTWLRHHRSKERTKFRLFCRGHPARLTLPTVAAMPGFSAWGKQPSFPSPSHATTRTPGPCCCRDGGHRLSHRATLGPCKAGHPWQCPAQLGAAGREHVYRFLQHCSSKSCSRAQGRQHLTARLSLNQSSVYALPERGILSRLNTWYSLFCRTSVFIQGKEFCRN